MGEEMTGSMLPEDALALANAMAYRVGRTGEITERILAELSGTPYEAKSPDELRQANLGRTVFYLAKIETPGLPISWAEIADIANGGNYEKEAQELTVLLGEEGVEVSAEHLRDAHHAVINETAAGSGLTNEKLTADFAKTLEVAREVAAEHVVDVATVYSSDELYFETVRRAFSASETAEDFSKVVSNFSGDMLTSVLVRQLENIIPKALLDEMEPDELTEIIAELQLDPGFQAEVSGIVELSKEAMRQAGRFVLMEIYGPEVFDELPTEVQLTLMPRMPLVPGVFGSN